MKNSAIYLVLVMALSLSLPLQAQIDVPAASPTATLTQAFGLGEIKIVYSRPGAKGRTIMGELVPYGQVWRTGANNRTRISFSMDVNLNGKALKAGEYALLTIPGEETWTVIVSSDVSGSPMQNDAATEVARFEAKATELPMSIETFTIQIGNIRNDAAEIWLMWENTLVAFEVTTDVDSKVMASIEKVMAGPSAQDYYNAAGYYYGNDKDMDQARKWIDLAIEGGMADFYWVQTLKARIHKKLGDKAGMTATAKKALELAEKAGNMDYVKINKDLLAGN